MKVARPSKRKPSVTTPERREQMRKWYQANREKHIKACRAWTVAHPDLARSYWRESERRRRAKGKK